MARAVYRQMRRWQEAGVFEILVADVQELLRQFRLLEDEERDEDRPTMPTILPATVPKSTRIQIFV